MCVFIRSWYLLPLSPPASRRWHHDNRSAWKQTATLRITGPDRWRVRAAPGGGVALRGWESIDAWPIAIIITLPLLSLLLPACLLNKTSPFLLRITHSKIWREIDFLRVFLILRKRDVKEDHFNPFFPQWPYHSAMTVWRSSCPAHWIYPNNIRLPSS